MIKLRINSLAQLCYIVLGFFIISYVLYIRIILVRLPKELYLFTPAINYKLIILMSSWIIFSIYMLMKSIKILLYKGTFTSSLISQMLLYIQRIMLNSLLEVYQIFMASLNNSYALVSKLAEYFYTTVGHIHEGLFVFISYFIRFLIVIVFLIDVFYFFKLNYFYKFLTLLSIALFIKVLFYILKDFASNLNEAASYLTLIPDHKNPSNIQFKPSPGNEDIDLEYHIQQFKLCSKLIGYLEVYDFLTNYYNPRMNLIIYGLYFVGWSYILIFNLYA